jgi:hypothetical protein
MTPVRYCCIECNESTVPRCPMHSPSSAGQPACCNAQHCCCRRCVQVNLLTNSSHCGKCNAGCSFAHVTDASCSGGVCGWTTCEAGYDDCDKDKANGCEVRLSAACRTQQFQCLPQHMCSCAAHAFRSAYLSHLLGSATKMIGSCMPPRLLLIQCDLEASGSHVLHTMSLRVSVAAHCSSCAAWTSCLLTPAQITVLRACL